MKLEAREFLGWSGLVLVSCAAACTATTTGGPIDGTGAPSPSDTTAPTPTTPPAPTTPPKPAEPVPEAKAYLRFANVTFQNGAVDFCVRKQGETNWEGPLLKELGAKLADEGSMTLAFERDPGAWDIGVVSRSATSCDAPFAITKTPVTLPSGGGALAVLRGNGGSGGKEAVAFSVLPDESASLSGKTRVRFFHGSPNWYGKASVQLGSTMTFTDVSFGELARSSPVGTPSAGGYVDVVGMGRSITITGLSDTTSSRTINGEWAPKAGASTTLLLQGAAGSAFSPTTIVSCADTADLATAAKAFVICTR